MYAFYMHQLPGTNGAKAKCQNLEWKKQNGQKLVWQKENFPLNNNHFNHLENLKRNAHRSENKALEENEPQETSGGSTTENPNKRERACMQSTAKSRNFSKGNFAGTAP
jgi:hypothetical protein